MRRIKRKINKISKDGNLGCTALVAVFFIALIAVGLYISHLSFNLLSSIGLSHSVTVSLIILLWLLLIGLLYNSTFKDKKMSKKELISCLRSLNCTLPDFEIIKQTSQHNMGWGSNGSSYLQRTFEIKFKKKGASKALDSNISLYKELPASAPAHLSIEIIVNRNSNRATINYIESRDN